MLITISQASFDLMLLGDNTNSSAPRVQRYDPQNGVLLGSFGAGFIAGAITDIEVDQASGTAFVLGGNLVSMFNYNTGAFLSAINIGGYRDIEFDALTNTLTTADGGGSGLMPGRVFNLAGTQLGTFDGQWMSTAPIRLGSSARSAAWVMGATGSFPIQGAIFPIGGGSALQTSSSSYFWGGGDAMRESVYNAASDFCGVTIRGGNLEYWGLATNGTGFSTGTMNLVRNFGASTGNIAIENGHGSLQYIMNGNTIINYQSSGNFVLGTQTLGFATAANVRGMAVVVAPEPATMAALGLGALALIRRRRQQAS